MPDTFDRLKAALADRYAIREEIGAGGMATVYLAEDLKHHRKVAVKVLRPDLAATLGPERFLREIEVAAKLHHPHILPLYDSGEADGFLYYVMPYEEGQSLREKLAKEGELPVAEAVRLLRDVVDALAHAHKHGVVHRDIKPDNVLLSGRHALVTDFGVAKAVSEATGRQKLTTAGVALGTPAYMAPEQAVADPHIDHRADIYAVGVLAYELLTGRPPFQADTPLETLRQVVEQEIPRPSSINRKVERDLETICLKCLRKNPTDRYGSAEALAEDLERWQRREPILARFKDDPDIHLLLMSYGTGAVGLNLQFAGYVFLFDRWWNPAVEDQAINRAHRIGQKSPVIVTKFISKDTIEERIDLVLQQKRELFAAILGDGDSSNASLSLNAAEIFGLFDLKAHSPKGTKSIGPAIADADAAA